jgi:hypothetical protein
MALKTFNSPHDTLQIEKPEFQQESRLFGESVSREFYAICRESAYNEG